MACNVCEHLLAVGCVKLDWRCACWAFMHAKLVHIIEGGLQKQSRPPLNGVNQSPIRGGTTVAMGTYLISHDKENGQFVWSVG